MTDMTKLAQREKFEVWWEREYKHLESSKYTDAVPHIKYGFWMAYQAGGAELVEAVEKAQGMETYWKTQCRGITDHCEELQAHIAELESHTVKPPVHPTVASEKLDDETLQELIEFRRTTFEYHSKEGNKVQTIIHGVTLAALRELQERRKADSEPVATLDVQSRRPDGNKFALVFSSAAHKLPDDVYFLYRHAQPAPVVPEGLNPETTDLVLRFASALADKLYKAEQKYGRSTDWMKDDWYDDCLQSLWEHIEKGDPRDVAAYCAFMWYHGWVTTDYDRNVQNACRAAMLAPAPQEVK
ncbi:hypothetical protein [Klebsiella pneumoniae]|uniref:hypothetical protein n=1 Tax=Klebsiella pneumoniae TaxID=573 RepID=UPI0011582293|nr:hypothetical protein [Klebsiella pneumoniae]